MNTKRYVLASLATFVFIFLADWLIHGFLLKDLYTQTASLWRPEEEYAGYMHIMMLSQILFSFAFVYIFVKGYENKGLAEGWRYGFLIALLFSSTYIGMYSYQPLTVGLIVGWILTKIIQLGLAGMITAKIYKANA